MSISNRKKEHLKICLEQDVQFKHKTNGFENYDFIHCALPEMDMKEISTETRFLRKDLSFPLMISAMTGGSENALAINKKLAEICQETRTGLGLGSQRQLLENKTHLKSYSIVREVAPDALVFGNIGAVQIAEASDFNAIQRMVDIIQADAMVVHLNPLQEAVQPEGESQFKGILNAIHDLTTHLSCPVIAKEVGCGISQNVARQLKNAGVYAIDIAGAGGTSWAGIESFRNENAQIAQIFWDWGIPTALSLETCNKIPGLKLIASGGLRSPLELSKALALKADLCGIAYPALKTLIEQDKKGLIELIQMWQHALKICMFLTGTRSIQAFKNQTILRKIHETD